MRRMLLAVMGAVLALVLPQRSIAGDRSGTVSEQFLKLPVSARAVGMGGAEVAIAEGVASIAYNPAGILSVQGYGFTASYTQWFADINHSFFGVATTVEGIGAIGASVTALSTGDMAVTTPAFPEGTGENFRASDFAFSLALARQISDKFSVGVNVKYIQSYLYNTTYGASSVAFDAGTLYDIPPLGARLGVSISNLGGDVKFINESYSLPTALRFGVLVDLLKESMNTVQGAFQITRPNDSNELYNVGVEYTFMDIFSARAGYKFAYDAENVTAGFGVKLSLAGIRGTVDYGYNNFRWLPGTHSVSLELSF